MNTQSMNTLTRSTFVTVLAWIFIVLSGFASLISLMQNIMIHTMFRTPEMTQALQAPPPPGTPAIFAHLTTLMPWLFTFFLVMCLITFASSVGLLLRRNWARLVFIGVMVFGILWNVGGLAMQFFVFRTLSDQFVAVPDMPNADSMRMTFVVMIIFGLVFALSLSVLFGWIIKRLMSTAIVAEFRR